MKLKFLLPAVLFFYCFNSFAQDNLKSSQSNNDYSASVMGGCQGWSISISYSAFPPADTVVGCSWCYGSTDTVYASNFDSMMFDANWEFSECGPIAKAVWFENNIPIDSNFYTGWVTHSYRTVYQPGEYQAVLYGINGYPVRITHHVLIINSNTTSINNQTNPNLIISVIKNKIIVKDLLEKDNLLLSVYDLTGRSIFNKEIISPAGSFEIEIPNLSSGLYVLNLKNKDINFLKKFNSSGF